MGIFNLREVGVVNVTARAFRNVYDGMQGP